MREHVGVEETQRRELGIATRDPQDIITGERLFDGKLWRREHGPSKLELVDLVEFSWDPPAHRRRPWFLGLARARLG